MSTPVARALPPANGLLIAGPRGSGKSHAVMAEVRRRLASRQRDFRLLVPTATMAEHLRNELAREGFAFPPELVSTLAHFLDGYSGGLRPAPAAALPLLVEAALARRAPAAFARVAGLAGFSRYLARLIEELSTAGCEPARLPGGGPIVSAFGEVYRAVLESLGARGWLARHELLASVAARIRSGSVPSYVCFDGFLSMTGPELEVVRAVAGRAEVIVTLPLWSGSEAARDALLGAGFEERRLGERRRGVPRRVVVEARSQAQECDEIARRVLAVHDSGRAWREMGVIVRGPGPYVEALRLSFERFGVPARFYFSEPASGHHVIRFLAGLVEARRGERAMPGEWAQRLQSLRELVPPQPLAEPFTHPEALLARSAAVALDAFDAAAQEAAQILEVDLPVGFAEYWRIVRAVLDAASLRVPDRRRDVVHVIDVYEARQWELPVVFVCGLLEREFPRYHSEDPVFNDPARRRLAAAGVRLRTSEERQLEERFLFEIATSRATELEVLSYSRYNAKGDENLRSFFLDPGVAVEAAVAVRPAPRGPARVPAPGPILDDALREFVAHKHSTLAPTAIEAFLQCPFQFFARHTLDLEPEPDEPPQVGIPLQGRILHEVLAELARSSGDPIEVLNRVFASACERERVPEGYRREAVRLELARRLEAFLASGVLRTGWETEVEQPFELALGGLDIRGRIDRVDVDPETRRAIVVDYKYSSPDGIRKNVKAHEEGRLVQGGLYLLAAEKCFGLKPAAMVYCGLKGEAAVQGWRSNVPELPATVTNCAPDVLRAVIDQAVERGLEAAGRIRAGEVRAAPADTDKCRFCDFADICRVESAPARVTAVGGAA